MSATGVVSLRAIEDHRAIAMTRAVWCLVATSAILTGAVMSIGLLSVLVRKWEWPAFFGFLVGVLFAGIGAAVVAAIPYASSASSDGLELAFILGKKRVRWDEVESYRPLTLNASFRPGEAGVWTLLRYRTRRGGRLRVRRVAFCLRGEGPGFGSLDEFKTLLDLHIPDRRR